MRRLSILMLPALFLTGFVLAADPAPKDKGKEAEKPKAKEAEEEVLVFTTEDLERKYGPSTAPTPTPKPAAKPGEAASKTADPLEWMKARQQADRDKVVQRDEARQRVQAAQARIKELEARIAQLRNPLLGRAEPEDAEKEAWAESDQAGRVKIAQDGLAEARKELQDAVQELARLR